MDDRDHQAPPQDVRVDRRAFLQRMGALTAAAAAGGVLPAPARAEPGPRISDGRRFYREALAPPLSAPGSADPTHLSIREAGVLLRSGDLSASELVGAHLDRIARWDRTYQAFNTVLADSARSEARELDGRRAEGLLHGIPLALKDNYYTQGVITTANSWIYQSFVPAFDATAVARLRAAGAIRLGKTQMGPLATTRALTPNGNITTVSAWAPHDPGVNPGGSSTGTATAVAARLAPAGTGTQTGGSITAPALAQGLTGLKPTMGRVSLHGIIPLTYTRDHPGPLARDAGDAALLLQAMAGPDPNDPRTQGLPPVPDYLHAATAVERAGRPRVRWATRVGVPSGWCDGDDERGLARRGFLRTLEECGAELVEVAVSERWTELTSGAFNNVRLPERSEPFLEYLKQDVRLFGVSLSSWINGLLLSGDEYLKGQRAKLALLRLTLDELFEACDVIVQPGHVPFDMIGLPLLALPIGFRETEAGPRPEGAILGGLPFGEERLVAVAAAYQASTEWHLRRPAEPDHWTREHSRNSGSASAALGSRGRLDLETVAELSE